MSSPEDLSVASDVPDDDLLSDLEEAPSQNGRVEHDVDDLFDDEDDGNEQLQYGLPTFLTSAPNEPFRPERNLDDEELDSGDDQGRNDRLRSTTPASALTDRSYNVAALKLPRHIVPDPSDNEVSMFSLHAAALTLLSCIFSKYQTSSPSSPEHGIPQRSKYRPQSTIQKCPPRTPSRPTTLHSPQYDGAVLHQTRRSYNPTRESFAGQTAR
jgi:hypothetical protein